MGLSPVKQINAAEAALMRLIKEENGSKSHVTLRVQGEDGEDYDVYYRFKKDFPLHHLQLNYCNRLGKQYGVVRFTFNGVRVSGAKTPNDLKMKNGDVIVAWVDKTGG